jgi:hypothetical protein
VSEHKDDSGNVVRLDTVRDAIKDAMRQAIKEAKPKPRKKSGDDGGGGPPFVPPSWEGPLPRNCPVRPLGYDGLMYHVLANDGQRISVTADKIGRNIILAMFGGEKFLVEYWPAYDKNGKPNGEWKHGRLSPALIEACQIEGMWSPIDKERGVGCWSEKDMLIFHCGDILVTSKGRTGTGLRERFLYPSMPKIPEPILNIGPSVGAELATDRWGAKEWGEIEGPGARVMERLTTWNFARPFVDPVLILGDICCAMLGAALQWRPMMVLTGGTSTGKSTLIGGLKAIIGLDAIVTSGNATQAAIARKVGNTTKPVILDEFEQGSDEESNRRVNAMLELAILASSGETLDRGTPGAETHTFQARNCFIFSAINLPGMKPQFLNRIFVIEVQPLDDALPPAPDEANEWGRVEEVWGSLDRLEKVGRELRGRLLDQWPRYKRTLGAYHRALRSVGHDRRAADQFGAALTGYDLAMFDSLDDERVNKLVLWVPASTTAETSGTRTMQEQMISYLLEQQTSLVKGGKQYSVGKLIQRARSDQEMNQGESESEARQMLSQVGIKVFRDVRFEPAVHDSNYAPHWTIAIATEHSGTAHLLAGTPWHKRAGSSSAYAVMLRRLPGAESVNANGARWRLRIEGRLTYMVFVPYETLFPPGETQGDEKEVVNWRDAT